MLPPFELKKSVFLLGTEHFNLYLIKGETYAILEGGVSAITYPFLNQLAHLNVPAEAISHFIILHSHFDHMMVFPTLKERCPWVKLVSSKLNQPIFSNERILAKIVDSDRKMTSTLRERGLISEAPTLTPPLQFPLDLSVEEGSILDLGKGVKIKFIETPGHSPDGLSALLDGILFCSDSSGFYTPPDFFRPNYWFNLGEAEKSIDKMKTFDPEILCRGHYGGISGRELVGKHLQKARQCIEDFKAWVFEKVQEGRSMEEMTQEVTVLFSRGFLQFFPPEENHRLWKLLILRTLEHLNISTH